MKATGGPGGDPSLFDFSASGDPSSLPISPILSITLDDSSRDESDTTSGTDSLLDALLGYSPTDLSRPILTSSAEVFSGLSDQSRCL